MGRTRAPKQPGNTGNARLPRITPAAIPAFALEDRRAGRKGAPSKADVGLLVVPELLEVERVELLRVPLELLNVVERVEDVNVSVTVFTVWLTEVAILVTVRMSPEELARVLSSAILPGNPEVHSEPEHSSQYKSL